MAIEAVLFDYSGVLTTPLGFPDGDLPFDADAAFVEMAAALTTNDGHLWHDLERGEISLDAFIADVESRVPGIAILFEADSASNAVGSLDLLDDRLLLAADLKAAGQRIGVLSNNVAEWKHLWQPRLPDGLFEIVIDSADVGCRKPEPAIYELAMAQLDIADPSTVLFIDDFEWNVDGAVAVGMVGLHCGPDTDLRAAVAEHIPLT